MTGKTKVLGELHPIYQSTRQPVLKAEYLRLIADRLAVSETVIQRQLQHDARHLGKPQMAPRPPAPLRLSQSHSLEENILRMMIQHPDMIGTVKDSGAISCFQETGLRSIAEVVTQAPYPPEGDFSASAVHDRLPESELKECFTRLLLDPFDINDASLHLQDWLDAVLKRGRKQRWLDLQAALRQAEQSGDQLQIRRILAEIQGLNDFHKRPADTRSNV